MCAMVKIRYIGDGHPTSTRNPYNGYINPYYWVDEFIPYYMEIMGVDRPDGTCFVFESFQCTVEGAITSTSTNSAQNICVTIFMPL